MTDGAGEWLHSGRRVIRRVGGDGESPWPGTLVCNPGGETALAVDTAVVGEDWFGWTADPDGHLLAPADVVRRPDGHDVLLPVCTERLDAFLTRRDGGADLAEGEAVTVAVSLLRGVAQLRPDATDREGTWWLTEAGRPVLATDTGRGAVAQTVEHLRQMAAALPALSEVLEEAAVVVADPRRRRRDLEHAESAIFGVADPVALATATFGPRRVRTRATADRLGEAASGPPAAGSWAVSLLRSMDGEWADLVSRTTTSLWRAVRTPRAGRRRPWIIAGGLAAIVLVSGLMWPTAGSGPATADAPSVGRAPSRAGSATPDAASGNEAATPSYATEPDQDLAVVTDALLTARMSCENDECVTGLVEPPGTPLPNGVIDLPTGSRTITLLDEFGGAAVLRAEAIDGGTGPQLIVIVRAGDRWLLRDVYDVPQQ